MSSECDFINRELSENTSSASTTDKAARGTSRGARPDPTRIGELAMHVTIARTPAAVMTRRAVPARRRTRTAPVVVAASSPEGVPKKAPDERRRAPAAVATAADLNANPRGSSPSPRAAALHRNAFILLPRIWWAVDTFVIRTCTMPVVATVAMPPVLLVCRSLNDAPSARCGRAVAPARWRACVRTASSLTTRINIFSGRTKKTSGPIRR